MVENKVSRDLESRAVTERVKQWAPAELLPEPDKQPGYAYHWVRISTLNSPDPRNRSAKLREGWEPVKATEQPGFQLLIDPTSQFKDEIEIGGLLLCKTPIELVEQRNEHFARKAAGQIESVDNNLMRQSDPRMPLFTERKSTTSFGKGK